MALDEFTWSPRPGMQPSVAPRVVTAKFGDGYEQRSPDGLNAILRNYQLSFRQNRSEAKLLEQFFIDRSGVRSFLWTPPDTGVQGRYLCRQWQKDVHFHYADINCSFEQVTV